MSWTVYEHITPSGKRYIGITHLKPERRWRNGEGYNQKGQQCFYNAIKKYKWDNIQHNIVSTDLTEKEAKWLENYLICYYRTFVGFKDDCKGYNCTLGGDSVCGLTPMKGKHHTEESRRKNSEANKGEKNPNYGKHPSEETLRKRSESMKGKNKGKQHDEETKKRISKSMKGKPSNIKGMHRVYHEDGTFHMER